MRLSKAIFYISLFIQQSTHGRFLCAGPALSLRVPRGKARCLSFLKDSVENESIEEKRALSVSWWLWRGVQPRAHRKGPREGPWTWHWEGGLESQVLNQRQEHWEEVNAFQWNRAFYRPGAWRNFVDWWRQMPLGAQTHPSLVTQGLYPHVPHHCPLALLCHLPPPHLQVVEPPS